MAKYIKSSYKNYFLVILFSILISSQLYNNCSICLTALSEDHLIDIWGNKFHKQHENEGHYCNSCSRLISEVLTYGGYKTPDQRYICSLCYPHLIYQRKTIETSRSRVINQLEKVGFTKLFNHIPIILLDKSELLQISETTYHKNLKGFTIINKKPNGLDDYEIYILNNLHQIEFDAVLAHEYLHVWQHSYNIHLNNAQSEGLSNLASQLIYENYDNTFSNILKDNLVINNDQIYGIGYRKMKTIKDQVGWHGLIKRITTDYSY